MSGWPTVQLQSIARLLSGGTPSKQQPSFWQGDIPWVSPKDMNGDPISDAADHIALEAVAGSATKLVPAGSIVAVVRSGILARTFPVALTEREVAFNQDIKAICVDRARVEPEFVLLGLRAREADLLRNGVKRGATVHSVASGYLERLRIHLPPLDEQRRIVDLLNRAAGIRRLREQALAKARALVPALFLDMFGDPAANPKRWPLVELGAVATVGSGSGFPKSAQRRVDQEYPFLKVSDMNLRGNEVEIVTWNNSVDEEVRHPLRATSFPAGAVIFSKIGAAIATNKKRLLVTRSCVDNNVMAVSPDSTILHPLYLLSLFHLKRLSDFASESNPPSMRKTNVEAWQIPLAPLADQEVFAQLVQEARSISAQHERGLVLALAVEQSLMGRLLG